MTHEGCGGALTKTKKARGVGKFQCKECGAVLDFGEPSTPVQEQRNAHRRTPSLTDLDGKRPSGSVRYGHGSKRY